MSAEAIAALEARLKKLDAVAEDGIDDPVRLFEDTERVARDAIAMLRQAAPANPDYRPDHDSLFVKFEQLESLLDMALRGHVEYRSSVCDALEIIQLIRGMVLK